jgi:hypothetical protein
MYPAVRYVRYNAALPWFEVGHSYLNDVITDTEGNESK